MKFVMADADQKRRLLDIAQRAIKNGMAVAADDSLACAGNWGTIFAEQIPNFVSVNVREQLRGCIGNLRPEMPLQDSVYHHARSAAFFDHRFKPISKNDLPGLVVEIIILSPLQEIRVRNEEDLLRQLEPGQHGLLLEHPLYRATFLPKVWGSLPSPAQFLLELKRKAGMADHWWSGDIRCFLYSAESFSRKILG